MAAARVASFSVEVAEDKAKAHVLKSRYMISCLSATPNHPPSPRSDSPTAPGLPSPSSCSSSSSLLCMGGLQMSQRMLQPLLTCIAFCTRRSQCLLQDYFTILGPNTFHLAQTLLNLRTRMLPSRMLTRSTRQRPLISRQKCHLRCPRSTG
jgi:hypothetical protein